MYGLKGKVIPVPFFYTFLLANLLVDSALRRVCQGTTILTRRDAKREEDPKEVRGYIQREHSAVSIATEH
jgi:hypothetical protein